MVLDVSIYIYTCSCQRLHHMLRNRSYSYKLLEYGWIWLMQMKLAKEVQYEPQFFLFNQLRIDLYTHLYIICFSNTSYFSFLRTLSSHIIHMSKYIIHITFLSFLFFIYRWLFMFTNFFFSLKNIIYIHPSFLYFMTNIFLFAFFT